MFKNIGFKLIAALLSAVMLCSCGIGKNISGAFISVDESAPVISFAARTSDGELPEYYLFDDNPEHLNSKFLADGETPSSIAHFEGLMPGIYTVFSYHHRGYSVDLNADLYYDAVFSSDGGGSFEILNLGLDHDWDWNQAWADYTNMPVSMPEFLRTFNCTCGEECPCGEEDGECINAHCPAVIRNQRRDPKTEAFVSLNRKNDVKGGEQVYLSELEERIGREDINHFRYGGWNEPMWLMMRFKVTDGSINFDTVAYQNIEAAKANFGTLLKGPFDNEPQYKGIAANAPDVTAELSIEIDDDTNDGPLPVTVKNMRVPGGYTIPDGTFATNVNTWRESRPIAAESDMMRLEYEDETKLPLYGVNTADRDSVWRFDPFHTKLYGGYDEDYSRALSKYGVPTGGDFVPNIETERIKYPTGVELSSDKYYSYTACNLGNFGVTERYIIHAVNRASASRSLTFELKSIAGQVYRFSQTDENGETVCSDGGQYIMKKFDDDPKEDLSSDAEPKERLKPAEYGDTLSFEFKPGCGYDIEVEVTTLTGCVAPMHNTFGIYTAE